MSSLVLVSHLALWLLLMMNFLLVLTLYRHFGLMSLGTLEGVQRDGLAVGDRTVAIIGVKPNGLDGSWSPSPTRPSLLLFAAPDCEPCRAVFSFTVGGAVAGIRAPAAWATHCDFTDDACQCGPLNGQYCVGCRDAACPSNCTAHMGHCPAGPDYQCWCTKMCCFNCSNPSASFCGHYKCCDCDCPLGFATLIPYPAFLLVPVAESLVPVRDAVLVGAIFGLVRQSVIIWPLVAAREPREAMNLLPAMRRYGRVLDFSLPTCVLAGLVLNSFTT